MEVQITHLIVTQRSKEPPSRLSKQSFCCEKNKDSPYVVGLWEQKEQLQKRLEEESDETRLHY